MENKALQQQLTHKTVRHFTPEPLGADLIQQLLSVAQHTATSHYLQAFSVITITDGSLRQQIAQISKQSYVAGNGQLFIFVIDQHRVATFAQTPDLAVLGSADKFLQGASDTLLAVQNTVNAAEKLGLGTVILGSVLNDAQRLIDLLHLPSLTFPIAGLIVGHPDQATQAKPRLPQALMSFENHYALPDDSKLQLADYDQVIAEYYATRLTNRRSETFTHLLTKSATTTPAKRGELLQTLHAQGFLNE
ncbi:nitroreductase family protein [Lacticaseibacillus jixiensis]|uniref:nitroreductase family protein n=1 Tax=Lacticaseibacillus jixiensis TaxID=3231926 RepID=UPI0036F3E540